MRRRTLLATAAATLAGTAGCLTSASEDPGDDPGTTDDPADGTTTTDDPTTRDDPTTTPTVDPPAGPESGCPSFVDGADRTVCYYSNRASSDVYLATSAREFVEYETSDEVETLTLSLHNDGDRAFGFNPHDWAVKRWTDQGWRHVAPQEYVEPWYEVAPGETYEWILSTESHAGPMSEDSMAVVADLSSGENYAFRVHGQYVGDDGDYVECVARFEYLRAVPGVDPR